ncbi:shikimate kinase [Escherichia coli]
MQSQLNMTVAEIVEREEWAGFRARETAALEAVTAPSTVIATGGGIILTEFNRHFMQNNGIVVYLCAPVSSWLTDCKLHRKKLRPTLTGKPLAKKFRKCWKNAMRYIAKLRILSSTQQTNPAR